MIFNTNLTRLNFNYRDIGQTFIDKRLGLKISLGFINGMRAQYDSYEKKNNGFAICLQEQGMPQNELDRFCSLMIDEAKNSNIDVLLTKSDLPFDNRWYILGDIRALIDAAYIDRISLQLSYSIYDAILYELERYETKTDGTE
jgi:hypothetical protein